MLKTITEYEWAIENDVIMLRQVEKVGEGAVFSRTMFIRSDGTIEKITETIGRITKTRREEFLPSDFEKIRKVLSYFLEHGDDKEKVWFLNQVLLYSPMQYIYSLLKRYQEKRKLPSL
ncbi:hypothetical protein KEJ32_01005 [Candidatus Bathyarchaeota archaeon]|nr:hypothetical protein [Candidatus Bathyarchaeota archaeon]